MHVFNGGSFGNTKNLHCCSSRFLPLHATVPSQRNSGSASHMNHGEGL